MPYQSSSKKNEPAGKNGQRTFVRNPDVDQFLANSACLVPPTPEEAKKITEDYIIWEEGDKSLPYYVVASDASPYTEPLKGYYPSTQLGYVKNSMVIIEVNKFDKLRPTESNYVDPFKIAELHRSGDSIAFTLPGCNIRYKNSTTVKDGFRLAVYEQLSDMRTSFTNDNYFNVVGTLLAIDENKVEIDICPSCGVESNFQFTKTHHIRKCSYCSEDVYVTDSLRIHEQISDLGDNRSAITRFMNVIEHLIIASFIRMVGYTNPEQLSRIAFIMDGPLAIFGQPAKVHARLLKLYSKVSKHLASKNLPMPLIIGIQKTGTVVDHAVSIAKYIENGAFRIIDDEYRHRYIAAKSESSDNFGHETYYGQDFIYKTRKAKVFAFAVVYPFESKNIENFKSENFSITVESGELKVDCLDEKLRTSLSSILNDPEKLIKILSIENGTAKLVDKKIIVHSKAGETDVVKVKVSAKKIFALQKIELEKYKPMLGRAMNLISHFELELYENAIIPIALAHRHASISLVPGGKVLDLLSKNRLSLT
ncbi:hypothetical protein [Acinetobacter higginsii]|uniref:hypothetical protein n=1 Tax=Acinetobacter higginsii TaxID=70347 RepID=UPI001F60BC71|nr:hypothetical protein [Acinetobacter higginsii]MCI3878796.1 hypothetical protein [Acinetobacter higginsii]